MRKIFILLFFIIKVNCVFNQTTEFHFGVKTISTSISNLLRLHNLSINDFKKELIDYGYNYGGIDNNGLKMIKGLLFDKETMKLYDWRTFVTKQNNGIAVIYFKQTESMYNKDFTVELLDEIKLLKNNNMAKFELYDFDNDKKCPSYIIKLNSKLFRIIFDLSNESEAIIFKEL